MAALIDDRILELFSVHVESFQIAGGSIALTIAIGMLKGESEEDGEAKEAIEQQAASSRKNIANYPLAIPRQAGPGVFVTTIVFSIRLSSTGDFAALGAAIQED